MLLVVATACGGTGAATTTSAPGASSTTPQSTTTTTSAPTPVGCPQDSEFITAGRIGRITQPTFDSRVLGLISIQSSDGCERLGFDFETAENAPATTPPSVSAEFVQDGRIIRIRMPLETTVITDQLIETPLVERLYVVRGLDGMMFIDVHLTAAAAARISVTNSPAAMTLELASRNSEIGPAPAVSETTVLLEPSNGAEPPGTGLVISGYSRAFEATVLIVATKDNQVVVNEFTTAADWVETWGEFEATIDLLPGETDLFVGDQSPRDGSLEGVTIKLTAR